MKRPHILIFNPDQMRADALHHLGNNAAITLNMDKLSEEGVSFRNTFCQNPVCTPSRCSFMSGWYPHVRGHRTISYMMHEDEPVLLKELKDQGYYVFMAGKNDLIPGENSMKPYTNEVFRQTKSKSTKSNINNKWRGEAGSDTYYSFYTGEIDSYKDHDAACIEGAIEFIRNRPKDQPVCVFLPLHHPHPPYRVEDPYFSMIDRNKLPKRIEVPNGFEGKASILKGLYELQNMQSWTEDRWNELRATYLGMCARIDNQLGMVMDTLKEEGIYDDTAIFMFSDHGDYTGDYGIVEKTQNTFEDCLTNVPFIVKPPKDVEIKPGVSDALVELIDFYATVEDFAGLTPSHTHFGRSLRNVLSGKELEHRDAVFCEGGRLNNERHCTESATNKDMLSESNQYYPRMKMQDSQGPEHTKATMCRTKEYKYVRRLYEQDELYDLKKDPIELNNRINDPQLKDILIQLKERVLTWYQETCDVVPFEEDSRFSFEEILSLIGIRVTDENMKIIMKEMKGKSVSATTLRELRNVFLEKEAK